MLAKKQQVHTSSSPKLSTKTFDAFRTLIYDEAGISLSSSKVSLVEGRLTTRLRCLEMPTFEQYHKHVTQSKDKKELQVVVDLLTTNETYFFREEQHFDFMKTDILPNISSSQAFNVWSAASSTGQEAYTIAMVLAEELKLHGAWKIIGTDINSKVLAEARLGRYQLDEKNYIPQELMFKYCLKGIRSQEGMVMFHPKVKEHLVFESLNLMKNWPSSFANFDIVFLRNVMIYFDEETKKKLIGKIIDRIRPEGYLFVGHSESLNGLTDKVKLVKPSIYMKL